MYHHKMRAYYFFMLFGLGALYPLLGIYLDAEGVSGSRIGVIMSIGPIIAIFTQPMWGIICDRFQNPKSILTYTSLMTGIVALSFLFSSNFIYLLIMFAVLSFFQSAITPVADSLTMHYVKKSGSSYGSIRLWGAIGYAFAVLITGYIIDITFPAIIFYIFSLFLLISSWISQGMPKESSSIPSNLLVGFKKLIKIPTFMVFILSSFLIFGSTYASSFYFGIFYTSIGGTITGVGLFFFIAAGSEAPFMKLVQYFIKRYGIYTIIIFASLLSASRYLFYFYEPSTYLVLVTSIAQGISIGFLIPAGVQLVQDITPIEVKATGMSIYASLGNGLGTMVCTLIGGYILENYSITYSFLFFSICSILGVFLIIYLSVLQRMFRTNKENMI